MDKREEMEEQDWTDAAFVVAALDVDWSRGGSESGKQSIDDAIETVARALSQARSQAYEEMNNISAEVIWNEHLFHVDALVYGDKMIAPDLEMAGRLAALISQAIRQHSQKGGKK